MEGQTLKFGTIGWAIKQLHNGDYVKRRAWRMIDYIALVPPGSVSIPQKFVGSGETGPFLVAKTSGGPIQVWNASQMDLLAADWIMVASPVTAAKVSQAQDQSSLQPTET